MAIMDDELAAFTTIVSETETMTFESENAASNSLLVIRPHEIVQKLPPLLRWEVTRRHPYYLMFWDLTNGMPDDDVVNFLNQLGRVILLHININGVGELPSPETAADDLDPEQLPLAWNDGAISPVTVRKIVTVLCGQGIPAGTKREIAGWLQQSADLDWQNEEESFEFVRRLVVESSPSLDCLLPAEYVLLNPWASAKGISESVEHTLKQIKDDQGISDTRRRTDKIPEYLEVWDLREGWDGATYDLNQERRLKDVAQELGLSLSTVENRYQSAFKQIVGHEYSADLWWQVIGLPKIHRIVARGFPRISWKRPKSGRRRRMLTDALLSGRDAKQSFINQHATTDGGFGDWELLYDIRDLISKGWGNDDILDELEPDNGQAVTGLIQHLRKSAPPMT